MLVWCNTTSIPVPTVTVLGLGADCHNTNHQAVGVLLLVSYCALANSCQCMIGGGWEDVSNWKEVSTGCSAELVAGPAHLWWCCAWLGC
jgi:hypothetical protein